MNIDELWKRLGLDSLASTRITETLGSAPTLRVPMDVTVQSLPKHEHLSLTPPPGPAPTEGDGLRAAADLVVTGQLGEGGMGTVLQARQPALSRDVAVKIPRRAALASSLVEEARLAGSLEHPGIVPVHAIAFDAQGQPGLVMRLVGGVSWLTLLSAPESVLSARLGRSAPNRIEAHLDVFLQVCNAIAFAHRHGVLHRDLKPANVLIGEMGEVYVADWGVARRKESELGPMGLKGTPVYFAPEMCTGDDAQMDERTDVFLLGAVLYEIIAGHAPYARAAGLREAVAAAWMGVIPPLPSDTPSELDEVVLRAMAHDRKKRFASVIELRDAVAAYLRHASSHRLAAFAAASLDELKRAVALEAPREQVTPLISASRFGFMHALAEWGENAEAREGLQQTIEQNIRYEISTRHAEPARALLRELKNPPDDLIDELELLEADEKSQVSRLGRVARVTKDFDPSVAIRQRAALFIAMAAAVTLTALAQLLPGWDAFEASVGKWLPTLRTVPAAITILIGVALTRKGLLTTRLNRRFVGFMVLSLVGLTINRAVTAAAGFTEAQTMVTDLVLMGTSGAAYAATFHAGFALQPLTAALGVAACFLFPGYERLVFAVTIVVGMLVVLVTWTRWKSDLEEISRKKR